MLAPMLTNAQEVCPDGYPVDCGTGGCCPAGNDRLPGTNLFCRRTQTCYETANSDGYSFEETTVCGVPIQ